jgi:hypothetical protein
MKPLIVHGRVQAEIAEAPPHLVPGRVVHREEQDPPSRCCRQVNPGNGLG